MTIAGTPTPFWYIAYVSNAGTVSIEDTYTGQITDTGRASATGTSPSLAIL